MYGNQKYDQKIVQAMSFIFSARDVEGIKTFPIGVLWLADAYRTD